MTHFLDLSRSHIAKIRQTLKPSMAKKEMDGMKGNQFITLIHKDFTISFLKDSYEARAMMLTETETDVLIKKLDELSGYTEEMTIDNYYS